MPISIANIISIELPRSGQFESIYRINCRVGRHTFSSLEFHEDLVNAFNEFSPELTMMQFHLLVNLFRTFCKNSDVVSDDKKRFARVEFKELALAILKTLLKFPVDNFNFNEGDSFEQIMRSELVQTLISSLSDVELTKAIELNILDSITQGICAFVHENNDSILNSTPSNLVSALLRMPKMEIAKRNLMIDRLLLTTSIDELKQHTTPIPDDVYSAIQTYLVTYIDDQLLPITVCGYLADIVNIALQRSAFELFPVIDALAPQLVSDNQNSAITIELLRYLFNGLSQAEESESLVFQRWNEFDEHDPQSNALLLLNYFFNQETGVLSMQSQEMLQLLLAEKIVDLLQLGKEQAISPKLISHMLKVLDDSLVSAGKLENSSEPTKLMHIKPSDLFEFASKHHCKAEMLPRIETLIQLQSTSLSVLVKNYYELQPYFEEHLLLSLRTRLIHSNPSTTDIQTLLALDEIRQYPKHIIGVLFAFAHNQLPGETELDFAFDHYYETCYDIWRETQKGKQLQVDIKINMGSEGSMRSGAIKNEIFPLATKRFIGQDPVELFNECIEKIGDRLAELEGHRDALSDPEKRATAYKPHLDQYDFKLRSDLPLNAPSQAKPGIVYVSDDGYCLLLDYKGKRQEFSVASELDLSKLPEKLKQHQIQPRILEILSEKGYRPPQLTEKALEIAKLHTVLRLFYQDKPANYFDSYPKLFKESIGYCYAISKELDSFDVFIATQLEKRTAHNAATHNYFKPGDHQSCTPGMEGRDYQHYLSKHNRLVAKEQANPQRVTLEPFNANRIIEELITALMNVLKELPTIFDLKPNLRLVALMSYYQATIAYIHSDDELAELKASAKLAMKHILSHDLDYDVIYANAVAHKALSQVKPLPVHIKAGMAAYVEKTLYTVFKLGDENEEASFAWEAFLSQFTKTVYPKALIYSITGLIQNPANSSFNKLNDMIDMATFVDSDSKYELLNRLLPVFVTAAALYVGKSYDALGYTPIILEKLYLFREKQLFDDQIVKQFFNELLTELAKAEPGIREENVYRLITGIAAFKPNNHKESVEKLIYLSQTINPFMIGFVQTSFNKIKINIDYFSALYKLVRKCQREAILSEKDQENLNNSLKKTLADFKLNKQYNQYLRGLELVYRLANRDWNDVVASREVVSDKLKIEAEETSDIDTLKKMALNGNAHATFKLVKQWKMSKSKLDMKDFLSKTELLDLYIGIAQQQASRIKDITLKAEISQFYQHKFSRKLSEHFAEGLFYAYFKQLLGEFDNANYQANLNKVVLLAQAVGLDQLMHCDSQFQSDKKTAVMNIIQVCLTGADYTRQSERLFVICEALKKANCSINATQSPSEMVRILRYKQYSANLERELRVFSNGNKIITFKNFWLLTVRCSGPVSEAALEDRLRYIHYYLTQENTFEGGLQHSGLSKDETIAKLFNEVLVKWNINLIVFASPDDSSLFEQSNLILKSTLSSDISTSMTGSSSSPGASRNCLTEQSANRHFAFFSSSSSSHRLSSSSASSSSSSSSSASYTGSILSRFGWNNNQNMQQSTVSLNKPTISTAPPRRVDIIIIGDRNVGKSCLITRFVDGIYSPHANRGLIGIDFKLKTVDTNTGRCQLFIRDSMALRPALMNQNLYRSIQSVFICVDSTNRASFESVHPRRGGWLYLIENNFSQHVHKALILTKADCPIGERVVSMQEVRELAEGCRIPCYAVSALTGKNVSSPFTETAEALVSQNVPSNGVSR